VAGPYSDDVGIRTCVVALAGDVADSYWLSAGELNDELARFLERSPPFLAIAIFS
jgi:hypothetical protein